MCTEKHVWLIAKCFIKNKVFINGLNTGFSLWSWFKKTVYPVKTHWLSGKEQVLGSAVSKENYADKLLGNEKTGNLIF